MVTPHRVERGLYLRISWTSPANEPRLMLLAHLHPGGLVGQGSFEAADQVAGIGDGSVEPLEPVAEGVVVDQVGPR